MSNAPYFCHVCRDYNGVSGFKWKVKRDESRDPICPQCYCMVLSRRPKAGRR